LRAGVSTATKAVEELGYAPNPFARGLKTSKSRTIGFIAPEFTNEFFMGIAKGVESRLRDQHYSLVICNANENVVDERERLSLLLERGVDGVIVIPSSAQGAHFQTALDQKVPLVLVDRLVDDFQGDAVLVDNIDGTTRALELALAAGHQDIGFIGGNQNLTSARERYEGYCAVLQARGIPHRKELVRFGDFHVESGWRLMGELMTLAHPPPCVFLSNYFMHVGATKYLMEHRDQLKVIPELLSFDDLELSFSLGFCRTIVRQPIQEIGQKAAELLLGRMAGTGPEGPQVLRLKTDVVQR